METTTSLFLRNRTDDVGLVVNNKIVASMKDSEYDVTNAFTKKDLIACKCDCHAVGHDKERVICVHTLPSIYLLPMLLDGSLSEHLLVELCSRWNSNIEECAQKQGKYNEMKQNVEI